MSPDAAYVYQAEIPQTTRDGSIIDEVVWFVDLSVQGVVFESTMYTREARARKVAADWGITIAEGTHARASKPA